ncbi:hypothetical protein L227DRAFT_577532 [Lentinus tigrinus ALCF2SS1-6]|uniref:DH domain-containing protein n=1 Tax=Lentinus tigrinus ALCF2SS1-6 TaxID=1328759 RepID=A0A5C2S928_9APHY|nr:hypothetical protein L227DRAFT_577532 [Lentinus tigrinus ALCF2SS1-6]
MSMALAASAMEEELPVRERISSGGATEEQNQSRSTEMSSLSESRTASGPRSCRVDSSGPPEDFRLSTTSSTSTSSSFAPSSPPTTSPPIPPRSPLRPNGRTARGPPPSAYPPDTPNPDLDSDSGEMPLLHSRSFGSLSGLLDQSLSASSSHRPTTPDKPLPLTPQPSGSMPLSREPEEDDDDTLLPAVSASPRSSATAAMSKRNHALVELLTSERAYAGDLALIRDIHIPLALGQPAPFSATPATPPGSSASSSRTLSTASDSSAASYLSVGGPPMTREDTKIIFNNVSELAVFADEFAELLEEALGDVLDGGTGPDCVGQLFLQIIPTLEPLYHTYITKHPTAIEHLEKLPQTPALAAYLSQTRTLASSLSHAWDLPSLLIKPVQRLMKYPLLLKTISAETPLAHPDKDNIDAAIKALEGVTRGVNEGRRMREVVREVLTGTPATTTPQKGEAKAKKKGLSVGVAASVSLGRMKSLRSAAAKAKEGQEAHMEGEAVKEMAVELRRQEDFLRKFAKDSVKWADAVRGLMLALEEWAQSFGRVIWMGSEDIPSEAFEAFLELINEQLLPVCDETKDSITDRLIPLISSLVDSTTAPLRLLEAMDTLEPLHYGLMHITIKTRQSEQLLEASRSYCALRGQLFLELPTYLKLLDHGISACMRRFAGIQQSFYSNVRDRWSELWDALKVDEEANAGAPETLRVWWSRFAEVEAQIQGLNIVRPMEKKPPPEKLRLKPQGKHRESDAASTAVASSILAALDPLNIPHPSPSTSSFHAPGPTSAKARSVHSAESENYGRLERKSQESLHSKKSGKSRRPSSSRGNSMAGSTLVDEPAYGYPVPPLAALTPSASASKPTYHRTPSMPISPTPLHKAHSTGRFLDAPDHHHASPSSSNPSLNTLLPDEGRGRPSRKPSFRRRLTDSFRTTSGADTRHRRSPSLPAYNGNGNGNGSTTPSPSPNKSTFAPPPSTTTTSRRPRTSGGQIPALYECRVIHPCEPPPGVAYRETPFFTLRVDDVYEILQEAGHPSTHRDLPLYVDDGEDCLLLARNEAGDIGWVLASFLLPVD